MNDSSLQSNTLVELFALFMRNSMHSSLRHSREHGLSMTQFSTMMTLHKRGTCAISEIAEELGVSTAAASQMVDRMVNEGMILRSEDPHDRRVKLISLTERGHQLLHENFQARRNWLSEIVETLSDEEKEQVRQVFEMLVAKLGQVESTNSEHGHSPKS